MRMMLCLLWGILVGCAHQYRGTSHPSTLPASSDVVFIVPGVIGSGPWDRGLRAELAPGNTEVISWGAPAPLWFLNFQTPQVHAAAQEKLAARLIAWRLAHPSARIDVVAHSAGCGVTLGALQWMGADRQVDNVILLQPSVSPGYDLSPSLKHVSRRLHVFYSDRDTVLLKWRTGVFGTYDNVRTPAAGRTGFSPPAASWAGKVVQHPYQAQWKSLQNDGGHFGPLAKPFVRAVLLPLLQTAP